MSGGADERAEGSLKERLRLFSLKLDQRLLLYCFCLLSGLVLDGLLFEFFLDFLIEQLQFCFGLFAHLLLFHPKDDHGLLMFHFRDAMFLVRNDFLLFLRMVYLLEMSFHFGMVCFWLSLVTAKTFTRFVIDSWFLHEWGVFKIVFLFGLFPLLYSLALSFSSLLFGNYLFCYFFVLWLNMLWSLSLELCTRLRWWFFW